MLLVQYSISTSSTPLCIVARVCLVLAVVVFVRRFNDPIVQADLKLLPYQVVCVDGDKPCVSVEWKEQTRILTTEEISAMILSRMKETAEAYLGALCLFLRVFTEVAVSTHR